VGKPEIRTILISRWITAALLVAVSLTMVSVIASLSGRAYIRQRLTVAEIVSLVRRYDQGSVSNDAILATAAPGIADVLFFIPWGALAFLAFDAEEHRLRAYALTLAVGLTFALGLVAWQSALPTRVTGWEDAGWNGIGCLIGAVAGHLRKRVRIRFD
jgi:glycopeptide antibiotics resistance protein